MIDIKTDFIPLIIVFLYAFWHSEKVKSLTGFKPLKLLTILPTKGNICIKLDSLVKLWKAWRKAPLGEWNWLKKIKDRFLCKAPPTLQPNHHHQCLFQNVNNSVFKQSFNMVLKWFFFYLAEIRHDQLQTSCVLYPRVYHYGTRS